MPDNLASRDRERRLQEVARAISGTLDLPTVLTSVVRLAAELVDSEGGALAMVTPGRDRITYPYVFNLPPGLMLEDSPRGKGIAWYCVETGQSVLLDKYADHPSALGRWVEAGVSAFISVPVVAGEERIGALGLYRLTPGRSFSERDVALAESIGMQAGVAIRNARLFAEAHRQVEELTALRALALAGTESQTEDALIDAAVKAATARLYEHGFAVYLMNDLTGMPALHPSSRKAVAAAGAHPHGPLADRREISVPLRVGERTIGAITARSRDRWGTPPADERFLSTFAGQLANAIARLRAGQELRASEERFRRLADNASDIIYRFTMTPALTCEYMSPSIEAAFGYKPEEVYRSPEIVFEMVAEEDRDMARRLIQSDPGRTILIRCLARDGRSIWIECRNRYALDAQGRVVAMEGIARDVTERIQLETQLRQSQKMDAIGRLAGGVAHDFNNLLTVILNYSEQQLTQIPAGDPLRRPAEEIRKAADRAASLTRQLLTFSRKQVVERKLLDLNAVIHGMGAMLKRLIGEHIELAVATDDTIGSILADQGQIEQVILNLAVNARDAMPQGGRITIRSGSAEFDEAATDEPGRPGPGHYVTLTVEDNGCGMNEETLNHLFEPFFTTKAAGQGTGLGLSTVYGIVKQAGGTIQIESVVGKGTAAIVYLPRVIAEPVRESPDTRSELAAHAGETILVVEDEVPVRELVAEILMIEGFRVFKAADGHEAIRLAKALGDSIDVLLTDVVMPGMSGRELAESLVASHPSIRVLYMSGHTTDEILHHGVLADEITFLQKPFTRETMLRKLRDLLASPVAPPR